MTRLGVLGHRGLGGGRFTKSQSPCLFSSLLSLFSSCRSHGFFRQAYTLSQCGDQIEAELPWLKLKGKKAVSLRGSRRAATFLEHLRGPHISCSHCFYAEERH